jgi:hypothetical protein
LSGTAGEKLRGACRILLLRSIEGSFNRRLGVDNVLDKVSFSACRRK